MYSRDSLHVLGGIVLVSVANIRVEKEEEAPRHK